MTQEQNPEPSGGNASEGSAHLETKSCTKCGKTKPLDAFRRQKQKNGTYRPTSWCKACLNDASRQLMQERSCDPGVQEARRERDRERYAARKDDPTFREKERARMREYSSRPEVKVRALERSREWTAANPERANARAKRWRDNNRERMHVIQKASYERCKEEILDRTVARCGERRWRMFNQGSGQFTAAHVRLCRVFWGNRCAYCGDPVEPVVVTSRGRGFDHVVPVCEGGAHGPENVVVCCARCNYTKNRRLISDARFEALWSQIEVFLSLLPPESFRGGKPTYEVHRACILAEERMRGKGVPVGTEW